MGQQTDTVSEKKSALSRLKTGVAVRARVWHDQFIDKKFGGDTSAYITSRLYHLGAFDCGTCHYSAMLKVFKDRVRPEDVMVDVGCGLGRAINTWLFMGCQNRIVGLELDEEIAETARVRLKPYRNVEIITGDATENLPADGTLFYIFNSFNEGVVRRFLARIKSIATRPQDIRILYYNPVYLEVFAEDPTCHIETVHIAHSHFDLSTITFKQNG